MPEPDDPVMSPPWRFVNRAFAKSPSASWNINKTTHDKITQITPDNTDRTFSDLRSSITFWRID